MLRRRRRKEVREQALYILSEVEEKLLGLCVNGEVVDIPRSECIIR